MEHGDLCCATDFLDSLEQAQLILLLLTSWLFHLFSYSNCNFSFELEKDFEVFDYTWKRHLVEYVKLEEMHTWEVIGFRISSIFTNLKNCIGDIIYKRLRRNSLWVFLRLAILSCKAILSHVRLPFKSKLRFRF